MAEIIPIEGLVNLLKLAFMTSLPIYIHLFKNNVTPDEETVLGDLTEANYSGYSALLYNPTEAPEVVSDGLARISLHDFTFEHSGGGVSNSVYGYMAVAHDGASRLLLWANRFDEAPMMMAESGDAISFELSVSEVQEV